MKVSVKENKPEFEPIELNIVIESKEELMNLWIRLDLSNTKVKEVIEHGYHEYVNDTDSGLWDALDNFKCKLIE